MTVAQEILDQLTALLTGGPRPRVRALHLPPAQWTGAKAGEFGAIELDSGALGLSYLLLGGTLGILTKENEAAQRRLIGIDALSLASDWLQGHTSADRALGFAAVNALTRHLLDRHALTPPTATDSFGGLSLSPQEHVGMVGFFPPLVRQVIAQKTRLTVLELRTDLPWDPAHYTITTNPTDLRCCTQVLITSTVLLNHTVDAILDHCRGARAIAMVGPGAGVLPDGLFARGVTSIGGTWIEHPSPFISALRSGAPWGGSTRKFTWRPATWPAIG